MKKLVFWALFVVPAVLLGGLLAWYFVTLPGSQRAARERSRELDMAMVAEHLNAYQEQHGTYPPTDSFALSDLWPPTESLSVLHQEDIDYRALPAGCDGAGLICDSFVAQTTPESGRVLTVRK